MLLLPRPVGFDGLAIEVVGPNLVEACVDQQRYPSGLECKLSRLLRAKKTRTHGELDFDIGQLCAELARLGLTSRW